MSGDEMININVIIADRPYPLKISRKEEEGVRQAAREINEKVKQFQQTYAAKDKQDYLAMTALMYAVDNSSRKEASIINDQQFERELQELETLLQNSL